MRVADVRPAGAITLTKVQRWPQAATLQAVLKHGFPRPGLPAGVAMWRARNLPNLMRGLYRVAIAHVFRVPTHFGALYLDIVHADGSRTPMGLASMRVVTDAGVAYIVDAFQNSVELENMKYHGFGTGTTAESASQTGLITELTTEYVSDSVRPTGSQTENGANIYRTVGTLDPDSDVTITEHGIFSQAATGGGTLLDRSKFTGVALTGSTGDSLQATYDFTCTSGG